MAEEGDKDQKTEEPTSKRLEEAFRKGNIPMSREVSNLFVLIALVFTIIAAPGLLNNIKQLLLPFLADAHDMPADASGLGLVLSSVLLKSFGYMVVPFLAVILAVLTARFIQVGFLVSTEPLMPKLSKISPIAGFKRIFSGRSLVEFIKSVFKMIIVGTVAFFAIYPEMPQLLKLPDSSMLAILLFLSELALRLTIGITIAMAFIALLDYLYQNYQYKKSLRMTKQEIKDEYKQSEGDPIVKRRLRALRVERARRRMMADVPKADVVITNPTHFAVALQYDRGNMQAPTVVAKGQDLIALKIREVAEEHGVPVVENPPLARALYDSTDIAQEIPVKHYEAVAKIISYVYQLKGKKF